VSPTVPNQCSLVGLCVPKYFSPIIKTLSYDLYLTVSSAAMTVNKYKKVKPHSTLYVWEFANHVIKVIELANQSGYFLTITAVNINKADF